MVINKRAQGLPLNLIVIAAIAALVLVLVIAFTIGGFGAFFSKIFGGGQAAVGEQMDVVRTTCAGLCDTAKGSSSTTGWAASGYCNRNFDIDLDGDNVLGGYTIDGIPAEDAGPGVDVIYSSQSTSTNPEKEINLNCWDINVDCSTTIAGQSCSATSTDPAACACKTVV